MARHCKASSVSTIQFQESDSHSGFMDQVLSDIYRVPDKEDALVSPSSLSSAKKHKKSARKFPDKTLDLHGKLRTEALLSIESFVCMSSYQKLRSLLIITGKGKHSGKEGPVLKVTVEHWLKRKGASYVRNFQDAPTYLGGSGAIWVELRS